MKKGPGSGSAIEARIEGSSPPYGLPKLLHCPLSRCAMAAGAVTPLRCDAPCAAAGTAAAMQATNWLLGKKPPSPSAASAAVSSSVKEAASPPDGQEASSDGTSEAREPSTPATHLQLSHGMQCLLVYIDAPVRAAVGICRDRRVFASQRFALAAPAAFALAHPATMPPLARSATTSVQTSDLNRLVQTPQAPTKQR